MSNVEQGISNYEVFYFDILRFLVLRFCGSKLITPLLNAYAAKHEEYQLVNT